jgi:AraC-like DNA-binding protein
VLNIVLDRRQLERAAAELRGFEKPRAVRFQLGAPASVTAGRRWDAVTRFPLARTRTPDGPAGSPLLQTQLFRLAAAALLEAYPSTFAGQASESPGWVSQAAVRRALAYLELRAGDDIGLADIAAAARVSVRGLQAAFRRAGRATPLAELRRIRLHGAHAELRSRAPHEDDCRRGGLALGFSQPQPVLRRAPVRVRPHAQ